MKQTLILLALCQLLVTSSAAQERAQKSSLDLPDELQGVRFDQRLGEDIPLDVSFVDETGQAVRLDRYFNERPVVLALVYYECPMICQMSLNGLASSLKPIDLDVGTEFEVVVASINPEETPEMAARAKELAVDRYGREETAEGWHFLTGDKATIDTLADSVGFGYRYMPETGEYAHASGIVVLTPEGKVARYLFGIEYPPKDLRLSLVEASAGKIGNALDQVLLFCFRYDPSTGKYSTAILNLIRLAGFLTVVLVLAAVAITVRRDKKKASAHRLGTAYHA